MFISVFNHGTNIPSKIENPTPETVKELMAAFNGNVAFFELSGVDGYLIVAKGQYNRVMVIYHDVPFGSKTGVERGKVLDLTFIKDEREIVVDWGTETTPNPIHWTIPTEQALEIAQYFLEHEVPPNRLQWRSG